MWVHNIGNLSVRAWKCMAWGFMRTPHVLMVDVGALQIIYYRS